MSYWAQVWLSRSDSFQAKKKALPTKILSSFTLTAQPHQNIANRSD